ncbi:MAG TPA: MBL fold metallo-hydrolase [Hyphomicrobiaceae bacterium]|nr:MBL fold metallo-hydrolase [Hyphomicrobiaceae bacterium]
MKLTVVGCGDAFGSGGRLQTCFHVEASGSRFLIDCGATAMIGLQRLGLDPNGVDVIFISHLHGDHFAGLIWWLLHAHHVSRRTTPLTVAGPPTVAERFGTAAEALFPGSTKIAPRYELKFVELEADTKTSLGPVGVVPLTVSHPSGAPSFALRLSVGSKTLGFSGDTEWVETLTQCADGAELFICECYGYERAVPYHMTWRTIERNVSRLRANRILLTHMSNEMLANLVSVNHPNVLIAEDGMTVQI